MKGLVRIIAGKWRGRKLTVLDKPGLRPTTDRVKEMLFNWLMPIVREANCLDCFSGSGSLAFEALSRGAKQVTLLEKDKQTALLLNKNKQLLQADDIKIVQCDSLHYLAQPATAKFDLIFIDPPFNHNLVSKTIALLESNQWLASNAYIYIETELNHQFLSAIPADWHLHRQKIIGQVQCYLFIREDTSCLS